MDVTVYNVKEFYDASLLSDEHHSGWVISVLPDLSLLHSLTDSGF